MILSLAYKKNKVALLCIGIVALTAIIFENYNALIYGISKGLTTTIVIVMAAMNSSSLLNKYIVVGLLFCLFGDLLLLNKDYFVFGLISFFLAHTLFLIGLFRNYNSKQKLWIYFIFWSLGAIIFYGLYPDLNEFFYPVMAYVFIISSMNAQSAIGYFQNKDNKSRLLFAGALFFMLSDTVLAYSKFVHNYEFSSILILSTYWIAISLIGHSNSYLNQPHDDQF
ncbi:MAG: hypothetical protein CMC18_08540 [Flavobacteriaceae bacterium]|nr:hypothetical protein [Flavobacteriaceae bacterium]